MLPQFRIQRLLYGHPALCMLRRVDRKLEWNEEMIRFSRFVWVVSLLLSVATTSQARATTLDLNWTFDPTGFGPGGSGTLTLDTGNNTVTNIAGTWDGMAIIGIVAPNPYVENDNKLYYPGTPYLDLGGLLFSLPNGNLENVYYLAYGSQPPYQGEEVDAQDNVIQGIVSEGVLSISSAATPLPASLPLFAGGLSFVAYLTRRRKRGNKRELAGAY